MGFMQGGIDLMSLIIGVIEFLIRRDIMSREDAKEIFRNAARDEKDFDKFMMDKVRKSIDSIQIDGDLNIEEEVSIDDLI